MNFTENIKVFRFNTVHGIKNIIYSTISLDKKDEERMYENPDHVIIDGFPYVAISDFNEIVSSSHFDYKSDAQIINKNKQILIVLALCNYIKHIRLTDFYNHNNNILSMFRIISKYDVVPIYKTHVMKLYIKEYSNIREIMIDGVKSDEYLSKFTKIYAKQTKIKDKYMVHFGNIIKNYIGYNISSVKNNIPYIPESVKDNNSPFVTLIMCSKWYEEIENNSIIGLCMSIKAPYLAQRGICIEDVKINDISNNLMSLEQIYDGQLSYYEANNEFDTGRNKNNRMVNFRGICECNSILPIYINNCHWNYCINTPHLDNALGMMFNSDPFNYYAKHREIYPMSILKYTTKLIMQSMHTNIISDMDALMFAQLLLTSRIVYNKQKNTKNIYAFMGSSLFKKSDRDVQDVLITCLRQHYRNIYKDHNSCDLFTFDNKKLCAALFKTDCSIPDFHILYMMYECLIYELNSNTNKNYVNNILDIIFSAKKCNIFTDIDKNIVYMVKVWHACRSVKNISKINSIIGKLKYSDNGELADADIISIKNILINIRDDIKENEHNMIDIVDGVVKAVVTRNKIHNNILKLSKYDVMVKILREANIYIGKKIVAYLKCEKTLWNDIMRFLLDSEIDKERIKDILTICVHSRNSLSIANHVADNSNNLFGITYDEKYNPTKLFDINNKSVIKFNFRFGNSKLYKKIGKKSDVININDENFININSFDSLDSIEYTGRISRNERDRMDEVD